jgi:DNA-binding transcriptional LysR family regulator
MTDKSSRLSVDWCQGLSRMRVPPNHNGRSTRLELRQLRYFVTLTEELHFGRAAAREHIVQSALSQQVQRLERALGVALVERTTRHVRLTEAGRRFLLEARQVLSGVDRAVEIAQHAARSAPALRVGVTDESYPTIRPILTAMQEQDPELEIHQVNAGLPEQLRLIADGWLDVGVGLVSTTAENVNSDLIRRDPLGVLLPAGHHLVTLPSIMVDKLIDEPLLLADERRAPEYNQLIIELCRSFGFVPMVHGGTVQSLLAAADLVEQRRCLFFIPASCAPAAPGVVWRPIEAPAAFFWFVLWRAGELSRHVSALLWHARDLSRKRAWLDRAGDTVG